MCQQLLAQPGVWPIMILHVVQYSLLNASTHVAMYSFPIGNNA